MKQIIQDLKSGSTSLEEVPIPLVEKGKVLIKTHRSLVSLGTERMLIEFGKANYLQKARQQPDKVKEVLNKMKSDGIRPTVDAVFRKLDSPLALGYSNAGEVIGVGEGVLDFGIGDRVVSNGPHAEVVSVSESLVQLIPDNVSYEDASFAIVGAIAMQGLRLIEPTFGETIVVTGLGLIGLLAVQLMAANGCRVIGLDQDADKVEFAKRFGIEAYDTKGIDVVPLIKACTKGLGVDGVLIAASSKSNEIVAEAAGFCRRKGRIVLVGVIGLDLKRSDFYKKELSFQVSCSYGPGRYDRDYEDKLLSYPLEYVRWTAKRNFEAVLYAISKKRLNVSDLITNRVAIKDFDRIYSTISKGGSIASVLEYDAVNVKLSRRIEVSEHTIEATNGVIGVVGSGNFVASKVVPLLSDLKADIKYIVSQHGLSGTALAKKYNIKYSATELKSMLNDPLLSGVFIGTRHDLHAKQVIDCIQADKHVLVEKPLALTMEEIQVIRAQINGSRRSLTVGFNRRFAPLVVKARRMLSRLNQPINVIATMNAGSIPSDHWVQDAEVGGGRIIGEACHLIDLVTYLTGSLVQSVVMNAQGTSPGRDTDNASILLKYRNGSQGVINYFSDGHKSYPKERIEIYCQGKNMIIDNFRKMKFYGFHEKSIRSSQNKGHKDLLRKWLACLKEGGEPLIPLEELFNTSIATISCVQSLMEGSWIDVD